MSTTAGYKFTRPPQKHRACPVCGRPTEVQVGIAAREKQQGRRGAGRHLSSLARNLCEHHAVVLFEALERLMRQVTEREDQ